MRVVQISRKRHQITPDRERDSPADQEQKPQRAIRSEGFPDSYDGRKSEPERGQHEQAVGQVALPLTADVGRQGQEDTVNPELDGVVDDRTERAPVDAFQPTPQRM